MEEERKRRPLDNGYFKNFQVRVNRYNEEKKILPERQKEITGLAQALSEGETSYQEASRKGRLSEDEQSLLTTLVQIKNEIALGREEETLSAKEAEYWRKEFGFKKKEREG